MDINFHHRVSVGEVSFIIISAAAAIAFFWNPTPVAVVLGVAAIVFAVEAIDRAIHTTYVITDDGWLRIRRGRLSGKEDISIGEIKKMTKVRLMGGLTHYLLIEYGPTGSLTHVQPIDEDRMMRAIDKRREK